MPVVQDLGRVAAVVEHHVRRPAALGPRNVWAMHHSYSSSLSPFQAKTGTPRAAIAAAAWSWVEKMLHELQRTVAPRCNQGLDQHRGLDRHVQAADDVRALQRPRRAELLAQRHQPRHLGLGDGDLAPPPIGQRNVGNLVVGEGRHRIHSPEAALAAVAHIAARQPADKPPGKTAPPRPDLAIREPSARMLVRSGRRGPVGSPELAEPEADR